MLDVADGGIIYGSDSWVFSLPLVAYEGVEVAAEFERELKELEKILEVEGE